MSQKNPKPSSSASNRREFVQASAGFAALGCASIVATTATTAHSADAGKSTSLIRPGDTILFQGDSITDVGRDREAAGLPNQQGPLGNGYAWLAAAAMLVDRPNDDLKIFNRGISGDKVYQLDDRWQKDCLDIKPNVLSILIGVNDIWHMLKGKYNKTVVEYEQDYRALIERTKAALPNAKLVICEPFVLRCGAVDDKWFPEFDGYRAAAKRVSDAGGATFVPFQPRDQACTGEALGGRRCASHRRRSGADGAYLVADHWGLIVSWLEPSAL